MSTMIQISSDNGHYYEIITYLGTIGFWLGIFSCNGSGDMQEIEHKLVDQCSNHWAIRCRAISHGALIPFWIRLGSSCENNSTDSMSVSVLPRKIPIRVLRGSTESDCKSVLSFSQLPQKSPFQNMQGTVKFAWKIPGAQV